MADLDLDAIEARAAAAKRGPWVVETPESVYGHDGGPDWIDLRWVSDEDTVGDDDPPWLGPMLVTDAEFIAHARTDVPALVAALRDARAAIARVRALHQPIGSIERPDHRLWCTACGEDVCDGDYPCPTIRALDVRHDPSATTEGGAS